ncbi:MaoC family dehydratase N-terminal domain-containing protein [Streptomyces sp. NPDC056653]|uniref:MaoC family dehydratase N-terminal domain-containing protein n=1 Tax=Streptomyces sp. NPDC056653 TaxID=3345894 RepID=UPI0036C39F31
MLRKSIVGQHLPGFSVVVERDPLRFFARSIGDLRPVCHDVAAARAAGHPDLVVPPTYLFSLEMRRPEPYRALDLLSAELRCALHAGETFTYHRQCFAGDRLDFDLSITDYTEKRGGRLGLLQRKATVTRLGETVAELTNVLAIQWDGAA